ncbi:hypothetical protein BDR26DRAFT_853618 [Obelidium mucronatum]|nr:hypothetical protein BDR26DRAFT_853618 [Obelidium mucronatum]
MLSRLTSSAVKDAAPRMIGSSIAANTQTRRQSIALLSTAIPPPSPSTPASSSTASPTTTPPLPTPPGSEDCCMSGCAHCVWDVYHEQVEVYNAAAASSGLPTINPDAIDPTVAAFRDLERALAAKAEKKVEEK